LQQIQSDITNLAMGQPLSIPLSGRVTATEIATLSQIAQNAAKKMKDQVTYAEQRIGYQRLRLNQQYIRDTQHFIKKGPDGNPVPYSMPPHVFQGDFDYELTPVAGQCHSRREAFGDFDYELMPSPDSDVRAEKRSEAQSLMTLAIQAAGPMAMMGAPLNGKSYMDKVLEAFDVDDPDSFYSSKQPIPGGPQPPGAPGQPPEGAGPGGAPQGVTGPGATAPATSPSHTASLAGGVAMARSMSARGGVMGNQVGGE